MKSSWKLASFDAQIQILTTYTNEGKKLTKVYAGETSWHTKRLKTYHLLFIDVSLYFCVYVFKRTLRWMREIKESHSYFYSYNIRCHVHVYDIARRAALRGIPHKFKSNASLRFAVQRGGYSRHREILLLRPIPFLLHHLLSDDHRGSGRFHADNLRPTRLRSFTGNRVRVLIRTMRNSSICNIPNSE